MRLTRKSCLYSYYNYIYDEPKQIIMDILPLIVQLAGGAVGGNAAGGLMKKFSLGTIGNSIVGILGGGLGGQLLGPLGLSTTAAGGSLDLQSIITNILGGGVGGGILMAIIGFIKNAMKKK